MVTFQTENTVVSLNPTHITLTQVNRAKAEIYLLLNNGKEFAIYDYSNKVSDVSILVGVRHKFRITTAEFDSLANQLNSL
jgi:hypothetical protein